MNLLPDFLADQLNSRELAVGLWLLVLTIALVLYKPTRKSLQGIPKILLQKKILFVFLILAVYITLMLMGLEEVGIWDPSIHLADTIIWTATVALVMVMSIGDVSKEEKFFQKVVFDALKLTIVLEFIIGLYPFSLPVELLLVPVFFFLGAMLGLAGPQ